MDASKRSTEVKVVGHLTAVQLGQGSFGKVYRVSDGKTVSALKVIMHGNELEKNSAWREVVSLEILAGKPHIVRMIKYYHADYTAIYMECALTDLYKCLVADILSAEHARTMIHQVLLGIKSCHDAGIVHRDIRPDNILYGMDDRWKLADFGAAKIKGVEELKDAEYANIAYRAPEMFLGIHEPAQDIWALGIIIAGMITGTHIFYNGDDNAVLGNILAVLGVPASWPYEMSTKPIGLRKYLGLTDTPLADLLERMLVSDPGKRITADEALHHKYFT